MTDTVPDVLARRAAADPDREALAVHGIGALTCREWDERSNALAHGLLADGIRAGDRVGLVFGQADWLRFAVSWCAVLKAGAVAVPLSDRTAPAERDRLLTHCSAVAALHGPDAVPPSTVVWSATPDDTRSATSRPPDVELRPGDLAQILFTSGTTGTPKGVAATHANLAFGSAVHPKRRPFAHSKHLLHAFPIGTNAAQVMLQHALTAAPTVLTLPLFTPARFARLIENRAVGTVFVVPAMAIELLNAGVANEFDLSSVLLLGSAAAALPPAVAAELSAAFPRAAITNYYTSTEASPAQTIMLYDPDRPGSLGRAAGGSQLKIADGDGDPVPAGETGEVWLRAGTHARTYYGEDGASDVFRDGWVRMGDLGYLDDEGYLYLVDRERDVIKSGAFKVSTLQVEAALHEHPEIVEAAAFGVPHDVLGSVVAAAVVGRSPLALPDVRAFLAGRLADHELPTRLLPLETLPRNEAGKVLKTELRRLVQE